MHPKRAKNFPAPYVVSDIQPYKSMVTGEMITSRRQHKEHLKQHGVEEVGNEPLKKRNRDHLFEGIGEEMAQVMREKDVIG